MASQDLFFEIRRRNLHFYLDAEETQTVMVLKMMIAGITQEPVAQMELWKLDEDGRQTQVLHDTATLSECGYSQSNAKAQAPAAIGLRLITSDTSLEISDVSMPPPIPDTMRQEAVPAD